MTMFFGIKIQKRTVWVKMNCTNTWTLDWWNITFGVPRFLVVERVSVVQSLVLGRIG